MSQGPDPLQVVVESSSAAATGSDASGRDRAPITVRGAVVRYPGFVLGPIDLDVTARSVHCLIGPNGSGKTTLVNVITGVRRPDEGTALVLGELPVADGRALFSRVGFAPDDADDLVPELSATELWHTAAVLHARAGGDLATMIARADELADALEFNPPHQPLSSYSHGMRKKNQLIASMLHDPPVLILDEPSNGLDPIVAFQLGQVLRATADRGTAVLATSHDLAWSETFADEVTAIVRGQAVAHGPTVEVFARPDGQTLLERFQVVAE